MEVDVRTNVSCAWFEVEMIGTLTGKDADVAARLAVYQVAHPVGRIVSMVWLQEYYRYRAKLQLSLIEKMKNLDPCPIKSEKLKMVCVCVWGAC